MAKNLIFCFDGTCNDPEDAEQSETLIGGKKDSSITNILKLHLFFKGDFKDTVDPKDKKQLSLYYSGVGTYGVPLRCAFNTLLAPNNLDVRDIIRAGVNDFRRLYHKGDKIFIFGFSRGAAIARRFASVLEHKHGKPPIRFIGVFDTVASIGLPDLSQKNRPASDVVFEHGHTIAGNIKEALHLVSVDDKRKAFQPTLMNKDKRVMEVWFAGAHSDVGGGYHRDGLSDVTLRFMLDELDRRRLGLEVIPPSQVAYDRLLPEDASYSIDFSDVTIRPDPLGKNHQQKRPPLTAWITLTDRELRVNVRDKKSTELPVVHYSVAERIHRVSAYRPKSLQAAGHQILYPNNELRSFIGLQQHQEMGMHPLRALSSKGEECEVLVYAHKKFNHTGLMLEKGVEYSLQVKGTQTWQDGGISCGPQGWNRKKVSEGLKELGFAAMKPFRRYPEADWFALIGCLADSDKTAFVIGNKKCSLTPTISAELCAFANDLDRFYGNNQGRLRLTVRRES